VARIQDDAIRDIRERASLVDVVSESVALRRRGRSMVGLCPFHAEKTPSFTVSEERGFYHCFGCGEHGDVFGFVMKTQALPFPEAVRWVAHRFGLAIPDSVAGAGRGREPLAAVNAAAATFYRAQLAAPAGARARAYLAERGLAADTIERFRLGWAPGTGDALARHLRAEGHAIDDALTAGLLARRERGDVYDRFRDRLMFPIADPSGRTIAFGGRILPGVRTTAGDPPPKYLNSPESPLFRKGQTLYGLAEGREAIRRSARAIVVEGYVDVLSLVQAGIEDVVAPLGTALTADQLRALRRFSETVVACFDGDDAGRRAAARSFAVFVEAGLWGRAAFLPAGEDPDSFVRGHGREAMDRVLAAAEPLVEAFLETVAGSVPDAVVRRAEAAREIARILKQVKNPIEQDVLARLAADRLGVREDLLRRDGPEAPRPPAPVAASSTAEGHALSDEQRLLVLMAIEPPFLHRVHREGLMRDFGDPAHRDVADRLLAADVDDDTDARVQLLPPRLRDHAIKRLLGEIEDEDRQREFADCVARIVRRRRGRTEIARMREELRAAESRGDHEQSRRIQADMQRLLSESAMDKART
jgi:DNA primase